MAKIDDPRLVLYSPAYPANLLQHKPYCITSKLTIYSHYKHALLLINIYKLHILQTVLLIGKQCMDTAAGIRNCQCCESEKDLTGPID